MLQSVGSQRVRHDWAAELNWKVAAHVHCRGELSTVRDKKAKTQWLLLSVRRKEGWSLHPSSPRGWADHQATPPPQARALVAFSLLPAAAWAPIRPCLHFPSGLLSYMVWQQSGISMWIHTPIPNISGHLSYFLNQGNSPHSGIKESPELRGLAWMGFNTIGIFHEWICHLQLYFSVWTPKSGLLRLGRCFQTFWGNTQKEIHITMECSTQYIYT